MTYLCDGAGWLPASVCAHCVVPGTPRTTTATSDNVWRCCRPPLQAQLSGLCIDWAGGRRRQGGKGPTRRRQVTFSARLRVPTSRMRIRIASPCLTPNSTRREIFAIALPSLATLAVDPLLSAVDAAFVGRVGAEPLASLAVSSSVFTFSLFLFNFLSSATGPLVGQALFRGEREEAARTIGLALSFAVGLGAAATVALEAGAAPLVQFIAGARDGAGPSGGAVLQGAAGAGRTQCSVPVQLDFSRRLELRLTALSRLRSPCTIAEYIQVRALGVPAVLFTTAAGGAFRGQLDARAPFAIALGENIVNALLLSVLVFGVDGVSPPLGCVAFEALHCRVLSRGPLPTWPD